MIDHYPGGQCGDAVFTQIDVVNMTNEGLTSQDATKTTYMGIAQFPKSLGEDWNLINRVVWTVPSIQWIRIRWIVVWDIFQQSGEARGTSYPLLIVLGYRLTSLMDVQPDLEICTM